MQDGEVPEWSNGTVSKTVCGNRNVGSNPTFSAEVVIYSDGSCLSNPGDGAFAFLIKEKNFKDILYSEFVPNTTNNRMELVAIIEALKRVTFDADKYIKVFTDSTYAVNGYSKWMHNWKANNWLTIKKQPVANIDLWKDMYEIFRIRRDLLSMSWIKSHSVFLENNIVDKLARKVAKKQSSSL